jgi:FkbM family methyltransferase
MARYNVRNLHEPVEEEWFSWAVLSAGRPSPLIVDVGAAIGYYSLLAKRINPKARVHAFEPLAEHRAFLLQNAQLNGLPPEAIQVHVEAVTATVATALLVEQDYGSRLTPEPTGGRSLASWLLRLILGAAWECGRREDSSGDRSQTRVPTTTLDAFQARLGTAIDVVKIDVQGEELNVLQGATNCLAGGLAGHWIVGTHGPQVHDACVSVFEKHGFLLEFAQSEVEGQPDGLIVARARPSVRLRAV